VRTWSCLQIRSRASSTGGRRESLRSRWHAKSDLVGAPALRSGSRRRHTLDLVIDRRIGAASAYERISPRRRDVSVREGRYNSSVARAESPLAHLLASPLLRCQTESRRVGACASRTRPRWVGALVECARRASSRVPWHWRRVPQVQEDVSVACALSANCVVHGQRVHLATIRSTRVPARSDSCMKAWVRALGPFE
jgi:hypothetical protein